MMRKLLTFIGSLFFAVALLGQAPASFKYQSVLRDSRGNFRANSSINIRIDIIQGSVSGATVFSENHSVTTDDFGLIALEIGNGIPIKNTLSAINWGTDTYFIRIFVEGIEMGTSQLLSVPYALHANTAQKLIGGITETDPNFASHPANGISSTNIINWNTAASWGDHASAGYLKSYPEILARSIDLTSKVNGLLPGANGGTGVANTGKTITLGGNIATTGDLTTTGAYSTTLNATETTSVTLPTKGTLATLGGVESITGLKTFTKDKIAMVGTSTGSTTLSTANISATNYTITLPAATGTIALTSDIARETMSNFPGTLAGDVTGTQGATVVGKINGISLARLSTGILKNTTISGFPSIAAADDFPVLNQNTNGTAANVTGIVAISNGGTGSITKIFVDLSTVQTVAGNKTLSGNTSIGGTLAVTGVATLTAAPVLSSATALQALFTNANNNVVSNAITGSGSVVMSDSPDLKGVPVAPTAAAGTNTTQIATTAFVLANGGTAPNGTTLPDAGATGATFYDTTSSNYYVSNGTTWNMVAAPDATTKETGKIQLAGDLSGTAALPVIAAGAVDNSKISELAGIVDSKLATISTAGKISNSATTATSANTLNAIVLRDASGDFATRTIIGNLTGNVTGNLTGNVTGNVSGTAANVTGVVAIANGGTGQTTALGAKTSLGLDNVDNTSDANKPVSSTQLTALNLKENTANKSTATALGTSDLLFPTQNAVKSYVDAQINNTTPDATTLFKGKVQLAGDLAGTAALPVIAAGAVDNSKISELAGIVDSKLATISTAGKISNTATTATSANTLNAIVLRDASGDFAAGTITGNLAGNAATVTTNANLTGEVTSFGNAATIANNAVTTLKIADANVTAAKLTAGTGTTGRVPTADAAGLVTFGNLPAGSLSGIVAPANGGTGIANNAAMTVTGSGNFGYTRTLTGVTNVTFPVTGTLATLAGTEALTGKTINGLTPTAMAAGFTIAGGTTSKTLSVPLDASVSGTNTGDNAVNTLYSGLVNNATHTGEVTGNGALNITNDAVTTAKILNANVTTAKLADANVTYAKIQNVTGSRLLGNPTASADSPSEITVSTGLNLSTEGILTATGNGGTVTVVSGTAPIVSSGGNTPAISISAATTSTSGSMSATDKTKLDGIATGATANSGTVTSVAALTISTTGTDVSSSVANGTTTPVITLNIPTASALNRGVLDAADWTAFNGKQAAGSYLTSYTETDPLVKAISGIVKSNGTTISAATSGADYSGGTSALTTGLLKSTTTTGALSIAVVSDFPTLNQSTTGNAATVTTNANLTGMVTSSGNATTVVTNANLSGEVTSVGNEAIVTNSAVIGKVLTGYASAAGTVAATDNILQAIQKLEGHIKLLEDNLIATGTYKFSDIEGNQYKVVKIGTQTWMAENLKTTTYNDGQTISNVTNGSTWAGLSTGAYCFYDNNVGVNYGAIFGAFYNWYAVNTAKLCPIGWHVPTDAEWAILTTYLGGESVAGGKLKETGTAHWTTPNTGATDEKVFTALPGGARDNSGVYTDVGTNGLWWSSSEFSTTDAWNRAMYYNASNVNRYSSSKQYGFSVRCLRD